MRLILVASPPLEKEFFSSGCGFTNQSFPSKEAPINSINSNLTVSWSKYFYKNPLRKRMGYLPTEPAKYPPVQNDFFTEGRQ